MRNHTDENKRIAKNTLMLYVRMFLIMAVTFISFRLLLKELGEEDYGIYNVVGGVVILFSFLNSAMMQSSQRFFSYHIGNNDIDMLKRMFSASCCIHLIIAIVVFIMAETIGLWFLNTYMNFPTGSMTAVNIVYQCSIMTFLINVIIVPYQAMIISQENMTFYAYLSIAEVILKLSAVLALILFNSNRLIIYGMSLVVVTFSIGLFYRGYCSRKFTICRGALKYEKDIVRQLASFSGWNTLGGIGNVGASQGVNIIFNIFYGVALNAAMGVANQVLAAVSSFVTNFQTAFNPQIIKLYAASEKSQFETLVFRASRFSFCLIFIIGFPLIILMRPIMEIWLTFLPEYSVQFTQLMIVCCMIDAISGPLWTAAQAAGQIKNYMIVISIMIFSNVVAAIIILHMGLSPVMVFIYKVIITIAILVFRLFYLKVCIKFRSQEFIKTVICPIATLVVLAVPIPLYFTITMSSLSIILSVLLFGSTMIECLVLSWYILLNKSERYFIKSKIIERFRNV